MEHGTEVFAHVEHDGPVRRNVVFRWCAGCENWIRLAGVEGRMRWIATHKNHSPTERQNAKQD